MGVLRGAKIGFMNGGDCLGRACALVAVLLAVAACTTLSSSQERRVYADRLAARSDWRETMLRTGSFDLAAWLPGSIVADEHLTVYIEGDGLAWLSSATPSSDPTPITPIGLQLALAQPGGNAAYLARPCQYVDDSRCEKRYWTAERFSPEVVSATGRALDILKNRFGASRMTLVGYSGGAAVAALTAARREDVAAIVSVAGNLDHRAWTTYHHLAPLAGSLNPADDRERLADVAQWHFVGADDRTVPADLTRTFAETMPKARVIVLQENGHRCCWVEQWPELWSRVLR